MQLRKEDRAIVIFCSKRDYFLAKICVASIRYFYPDEAIFLIKDELNGLFSTSELEKSFNVSPLDLGIEKLGWGAGKVHFLLSNHFPDKRVLLLDADIVFLGRFLDQLYSTTEGIDFVIDSDLTNFNGNPSDPYVKKTYFDYEKIKKHEVDYEFPGFVFNTGQLIVKTGKITAKDLAYYFNKDEYPYYTNMELTPLADQSILNIILAKKVKKKEISISVQSFMFWSDGEEVKKINLDLIKGGEQYPYLTHYAGSFKSPDIRKMVRPDILAFFQDYYFSKVPNGYFKNNKQILSGAFAYNKKNLIAHIKSLISKTPLNKLFRGLYKKFIGYIR